jgi:hypothetical protein
VKRGTVARATGICLVVYSYLGGLWLDRHGQSFGLVDVVREWLNRPLGVGEDFGVLGLMLLLLASGYAAKPGLDLPRLVRIAAPVGVAAVLAGVLSLVHAEVLVEPLVWVVAIELVLWPFSAIRAPGWLVPLVLLLAVAVLLLVGVSPGFAMPVVLFPLAVLGRVLGDAGLPGWAKVLFGLGVWGLLAWTEVVVPGVAQWWYPLTALVAVLLFLVALRADDTVGTRPAVRWLAERSRWLLVLTGVLGWAVLGLGLPFPVGFPLAVAAILLAAALPRLRATREVSA